MKRILLVLAYTAIEAANARAEVFIESVSWQRARVEKVRVIAWEDAGRLLDGPPKLDARLRARLLLKNRGPAAAEGILLRYSMTGRVAPISGEKTESVWAIPFMVDEKRVPKVGPNMTQDVYLTISPALDLYLAKLARAGWWLDRLKFQVMIDPHPGTAAVRPLENVLEVGQ